MNRKQRRKQAHDNKSPGGQQPQIAPSLEYSRGYNAGFVVGKKQALTDTQALFDQIFVPQSMVREMLVGIANYIEGIVVAETNKEKTRERLETKVQPLERAIENGERLNGLGIRVSKDVSLLDLSVYYRILRCLKRFCDGKVTNANELRRLMISYGGTKADDLKKRWETKSGDMSDPDGIVTDWLRNVVAKVSKDHEGKDATLGLEVINHLESATYPSEAEDMFRKEALKRLNSFKAHDTLRLNINKLKIDGLEALDDGVDQLVQTPSAHLESEVSYE